MSPARLVCTVFVLVCALMLAAILQAQVPTGVPQFGSFQNGPVDTVNLATLNVHFEIPIRSTPGGKLPFSAILAEESSHYYPHNVSGGWYWYNSFSSPPVSWFFDQWPIRTLLPMGIPTGNSVTVKTCGAFSPWGGSVGSISISNDVLTVTGGYDNFTVGEMIQFNGLTHATFLNGQSVAVASVSSGKFTARFNHANYTNTPDNGTVSVLTNLWQIAGYTDIHNTVHGSGERGLIDPYGCLFGTKSFSSTSQDGYVTTGTVSGVNSNGQYTLTVTVTTPSGTVLSSGPMEVLLSDGFLVTQNSTSTATDTNGNQISVTNPSTPSWRLAYTDSTGNNILNATTTLNGSGVAAGATYSYTGPNNATETVTVTSTTPSIHTDFGCSAIFEYSNGTYPLVNQISLPDGSSYQIGYDTNGRISSVTLPAGGTVSYNYNGPNNGMMCQDGGSSGFTRTTPDGTWTYARSYSTTTGVWTTTVTDPQGNNTVYTFSGPLALTWVQGSYPNYALTTIVQPEYEVQRQVYQLVNGQQVLMETLLSCYNGNFTNCATATVTAPITQIDRYTFLPGVTNPSLSETKYNNSELLSEDKEFDFNAAMPPSSNQVSDRVIQYGTYSGGACAAMGKNILSSPCTDTTTSGSSTLSQSTYQYDGNGNLLSLGSLVSGSTFLTKSFSYYPSGLINVATDVNGGTSTYTYGTCNSSLPTNIAITVNAQLTLNRSMAWNCTGETPTSVTDENSQTTTYSYVDPTTGYSDPYWRVAAVTDPLQNITHYTYSPTKIEHSFTFNSNLSTVDVVTTADSQGRSILMQRRQSPTSSNYDTVVQSYDSDGRPATAGLPCTSTVSQPCISSITTTTYDNLGRTTQVTDGGGGYVSSNYAPGGTYNNDVLVTSGPAPTGENTKRRQMEYDGLGRLTSVCELTNSSNGGGACIQTTAQTGFWTKYTYDGLNRLISVSQNAQSAAPQTRSFSYDGLGRLTSETNPESGTTTYTYDLDSTCGTSKGDVVKKVDSIGNVGCYTYDATHRLLSATYPSGAYAGVTASKYFVYDSATVNGAAMANVKGRIAEAYTCTTCTSTKLTDLGYSYTPLGDVSDVYEATPHSGGYYHLTQTYWPDRVVSALSGLPGLPTITYGGTIGSTPGIDGEGRVTQTTAAVGQNPITAVTYNSASLPGQVNFGSGDADIFAYDPSTLRMTQFKFNVGTQPQSFTGNLTWNANSTLGQLAIIDPFNSPDNQTCSYSHDDITRISTANCGSVASQTFSYDPFGNLSESGSPYSFQPIYSTNPPTNRFASLMGCPSLSYDADGNVLSDCNHSYTWDTEGNSISIDTVYVTFDAFDRAVEKNVSGTYTETVFAPTGDKLALMNGQALAKAFVPLPGQATAVYTSTGLDHYRHSDWLGSTRLTSSPAQAYISSLAYAPFGDAYASSGAMDPSFAGANPDTVSTDYDFLYRPYSTEGRWPTPDPAGVAAVDPTNPQSWNRYAYVLNNPLAHVDQRGLYCEYFANNGEDVENIDARSSPDECATNGGTWVEDFMSVEVSADPLPDPSGIGQWVSDFVNSWGYTPSFGQVVPLVNRCAARRATSLASLLNLDTTNPFVNNLLGNDAATASNLAFGSSRLQASLDLATSNPVKNVALDAGISLAGQLPVGGTVYEVGGNIATRYGPALDMVPTSRALSDVVSPSIGRGLSKGLAVFTKVKLVFDAGAYVNSLWNCAVNTNNVRN